MLIEELTGPSPELDAAIRQFEEGFTIPYADGRTFHIDYGEDRTAFIRSMGEEWKCLVAHRAGRVLGILEMALVQLMTPGGEERPAVYLADLKLLPEERRKLAGARLMQRAAEWAHGHTRLGYNVVMDSNPLKPPEYTGRACIDAFAPVARMAVVRLPAEGAPDFAALESRLLVNREGGVAAFRRLSAGRYTTVVRPPMARSITPPAWFAHPGGEACGRFEDRRKVRRLVTMEGDELRPAYLSCFAFADPQAGLEVLAAAQRHAAAEGFRAVRVCMPGEDLAALQRIAGPGALPGLWATVFATAECTPGAGWLLNASET